MTVGVDNFITVLFICRKYMLKYVTCVTNKENDKGTVTANKSPIEVQRRTTFPYLILMNSPLTVRVCKRRSLRGVRS